jgi:hypothetical protein
MSNSADARPGGLADRGRMTYVQTINGNGDPEGYLNVVDRVQAHADGLLARYAGMNDRGLAITSVWESKVHADRFTVDHLMPAIRDIVGDAMDDGPPPTIIDYSTFEEFHVPQSAASASGG